MSNSIFIVGGGPSLKGFDFGILRNQETIVVNNAIFDVPNPNYFITMDYTWLGKAKVNMLMPQPKNPIRLRSGYRKYKYSVLKGKRIFAYVEKLSASNMFLDSKAKKFFAVCFWGDRLKILGDKKVKDGATNTLYDLNLFDEIIYGKRYGGISTDFSNFCCGSDSGYSAMQLAIILGYEKIYLLGMDFVGNADIGTHYHNTYKHDVNIYQKKLDEFLIPYPSAFEDIKKLPCKVFSCSNISKLNAYIPYINIQEVLQ